jgi:sterol 24-C-methyltransferase
VFDMNAVVDKFVQSFKDGTPQQQKGAIVAASVVGVLAVNKIYGNDPLGRSWTIVKAFLSQEKTRSINVNEMIDGYDNLHKGDAAADRNDGYTTLVNSYYELATLFYEWGWGQSFHFSYQLPGETFKSATARHEYYLAGRLGVKQGDNVLDVGCGVGGPMRNIARFTRAKITGVTLNEYQVQRGNQLNNEAGLTDYESVGGSAKSVQADFMKLPFDANTFDGVYAIEATCHAPVREGVYGEIFKVLKPGCVFATYEWCLTPKYDKDNEEHRLIKKKIEEGDGLPDMAYQAECVQALKNVGFEVMEARDMALDERYGGDEWYLPLHPSWNPFTFRFQMTSLGKFITKNMVWVMELLWLAPTGTYKVQEMLQQGGWGCDRGGVTGTFTPMWLMVARKPLK